MAAPAPEPDERVTRLPVDREPMSAKIARLEELIEGTRDDIGDVKRAWLDGVQKLDDRLHELEDVRVRALEDWRLKQKVLETERARVADQDHAAAGQQISARQFWVGLALTAFFTLLAAVIASGHFF